jgi:hypothetical protein
LENPKAYFNALLKARIMGSYPDQDKVFLEAFRGYLETRVSKKVAYEYHRIASKFLNEVQGTYDIASPEFRQKLGEFLDIENPNTFRNTLACLRHLFKFLSSEDYLAGYKFKAVMPTFGIKTPSLEEMQTFGKAIENERICMYYYIGSVTTIRPEHLTRLYKSLFDRQNNMINTFQKTFGKKNFFFGFYIPEIKPMLEAYLDSSPSGNSLLFPLCSRYIQKEFEKASKKCGVKITPKTIRKFCTNWLRRNDT